MDKAALKAFLHTVFQAAGSVAGNKPLVTLAIRAVEADVDLAIDSGLLDSALAALLAKLGGGAAK